MKAIVLDLEMTNPSNKIIQIGAVLVNTKSHQILDTFDMIANPGELPSEFITQLTGITSEMVANAQSLQTVLNLFWKWVEDCKCGKTLYAWGEGDIRYLEDQSRYQRVEVPRLTTLNLKEMAALFRQAKDTKAEGGLKNTLQLFGMEFCGTQHNALDDAFNTALLLFRFEEMINFACGVEKTHGNPRVRNLDETIKQFRERKKNG